MGEWKTESESLMERSSNLINNEFVVRAPLIRVWETILDLERTIYCLPDAFIEESVNGEYSGTIALTFGSISVRYRGTIRLEDANIERRRAVFRVTGRETRGRGAVSGDVIITMRQDGRDDVTKVRVGTNLKISGEAAHLDQELVNDVVSRLLKRFGSCMEKLISDATNVEQNARSEDFDQERLTEESVDSLGRRWKIGGQEQIRLIFAAAAGFLVGLSLGRIVR